MHKYLIISTTTYIIVLVLPVTESRYNRFTPTVYYFDYLLARRSIFAPSFICGESEAGRVATPVTNIYRPLFNPCRATVSCPRLTMLQIYKFTEFNTVFRNGSAFSRWKKCLCPIHSSHNSRWSVEDVGQEAKKRAYHRVRARELWLLTVLRTQDVAKGYNTTDLDANYIRKEKFDWPNRVQELLVGLLAWACCLGGDSISEMQNLSQTKTLWYEHNASMNAWNSVKPSVHAQYTK